MEKESLCILTLNLNWYNLRSCIMCTYIMECVMHTQQSTMHRVCTKKRKSHFWAKEILGALTYFHTCLLHKQHFNSGVKKTSVNVSQWLGGAGHTLASLMHRPYELSQYPIIVSIENSDTVFAFTHNDSGLVFIKLIFHS